MNNITKHYVKVINNVLVYCGFDEKNEIVETYPISKGTAIINKERFQESINSGIPIRYDGLNRVMLASLCKKFDCKISFDFNYPFIFSSDDKFSLERIRE